MVGFGASTTERPEDLDLACLVQCIEDGSKLAHIREYISCISFSFGCIVAAKWMRNSSIEVHNRIFVAPVGIDREVGGKKSQELKSWRRVTNSSDAMKIKLENLTKLMFSPMFAAPAWIVDLMINDMERCQFQSSPFSKSQAFYEALQDLDGDSNFVWGAEDFTTRGLEDLLFKRIRMASQRPNVLLIPDAGHWVQFEQWEAFNNGVISMLKGNIAKR
jgi:pimeloyl-ACP methyl ester carboxylesterase